MWPIVRIGVAVVASLAVLGGIVLIAAGGTDAPGGLWAVAAGAVGLVAVALERSRYRSEVAERSSDEPGPGGGEPAPPGAPFRRTEELFVDPTSGRQMRVYLDPKSGERRYHAEG